MFGIHLPQDAWVQRERSQLRVRLSFADAALDPTSTTDTTTVTTEGEGWLCEWSQGQQRRLSRAEIVPLRKPVLPASEERRAGV